MIKDEEWYLFVVGIILVLLLVWAGFVSFNEDLFSIRSILKIHLSPLVWFVDVLVVCIPIGILFVLNYIKINNDKFISEIELLKHNNLLNIEIAERISKGELDEITKDSHGKLSETLLNLSTSLKLSKINEDNLNWVTKGKELLSDILRSHQKVNELSVDVIRGVIEYTGGIQGAIYLFENNELHNIATFAYNRRRYERQIVPIGKGLIGQVAYEKAMIYSYNFV